MCASDFLKFQSYVSLIVADASVLWIHLVMTSSLFTISDVYKRQLAYQFNYPSEGFDVADGFNISDVSSACLLYTSIAMQKMRDIFKNASIKYTGKSYVVLIGVENQSDIHLSLIHI